MPDKKVNQIINDALKDAQDVKDGIIKNATLLISESLKGSVSEILQDEINKLDNDIISEGNTVATGNDQPAGYKNPHEKKGQKMAAMVNQGKGPAITEDEIESALAELEEIDELTNEDLDEALAEFEENLFEVDDEDEDEPAKDDDEDEPAKDDEDWEKMKKENKKLKENVRALVEDRKNLKNAVLKLQKDINEVNLFNFKLTSAMDLVSGIVNESQKVRIMKLLDDAKTLKEAKTIYNTLKESINVAQTQKPLIENIVTSTKSNKDSDEDKLANAAYARMQHIAGLDK